MLKIFSIIPLLFRQSHAAGSNWILGGPGETCDTVCQRIGSVCNPVEQSKITSDELLVSALAEAGYNCTDVADSRSYAGSPFVSQLTNSCTHMIPGGTSVCDGNLYSHHSPLCYCDLLTATPTGRPTSPTTVPSMIPTNVPTTVPTITPIDNCKDIFSWCAYVALLDNCDDADFRLYCPLTCGLCTERPTSMPTASPTEECADTLDISEGVIDYLFNYALQCKDEKESSNSSE